MSSSKGERVPATVWGPALRAMLARATAARISGRQWRVVAAIVSRTASYSRLTDKVTHSVLMEMSGIGGRDLRRELQYLSANGVIGYAPGAGKRFSVVALSGAFLPPVGLLPPGRTGAEGPGSTCPSSGHTRGVNSPPSEGGQAAPHEQLGPQSFGQDNSKDPVRLTAYTGAVLPRGETDDSDFDFLDDLDVDASVQAETSRAAPDDHDSLDGCALCGGPLDADRFCFDCNTTTRRSAA